MNNSETEELRKFKNFSKNLKTTSLGVRFSKKLFTDPKSVSPKLILDTMKALGLDIPKEIMIGADVAQMIVSGQAVVSSIKAGKDLKTITDPSSQAIAASIRVFSAIGWLNDKDGSIAKTTQLGADVVCLIGSCGADWRAWASLAMSAYLAQAENKAIASQLARTAVYNGVTSYLSKEQKAFGINFEKLQKGELGLLSWLAKNALQSPVLFVQGIRDNKQLLAKFPFLKDLDALPYSKIIWESHAESSDSFLGVGEFNKGSSDFKFSMDILYGIKDENQARRVMFDTLIKPHVEMYEYANNYFSGRSLSMENASILLGMGATCHYLYPDLDLFQFIERMRLTPDDLGENFLQNFIDTNQKDPVLFKDVAVNFSGFKTYKKDPVSPYQANKMNILKADLMGRYDFIYKFDEVRARMKSMCNYPMIPDKYRTGVDRSGLVFQYEEKNQEWRRISNFVVALQYLELVQKDPVYFKYETELLKKYSFMKSLDQYQIKADTVNKYSVIRGINQNALANIAYFLNTSPDKLKKINNNDGSATFI